MGLFWAETEEGGWEKPRSSNWLTVLGEANIEAPVSSQTEQTFAPGPSLSWAMLRAGGAESYRAVARLIKPIRFEG